MCARPARFRTIFQQRRQVKENDEDNKGSDVRGNMQEKENVAVDVSKEWQRCILADIYCPKVKSLFLEVCCRTVIASTGLEGFEMPRPCPGTS